VVLEVPVTVAVNCCVFDNPTEALVGDMVTEMEAIRFTVAWPYFVVSAALVAVTVTLGPGADEGAAYNPVLEIVPTVEFPPAVPFTLHVTAVLALPFTVAVNCWVCDSSTAAVAGDTVTETPLPTTVTAAWADLVVSATLVAVTVTLPPAGAVAGAV
jgi:hypothetical protein